MATVQFALPFRPAWDANGKIIPGAQLYFTLSGTNTPVTVYADAGLTEPLQNPVVANQAGRFVPVHYNDATAIRARLYDEDAVVGVDTPMEDYNPYIGFASTTIIDAVARTNASQALTDSAAANAAIALLDAEVEANNIFDQPLTGGVSRSLQLKLQETVSAEDFGATGNGATDDRAAIQLALNTGLLVILNGSKTYAIGASLTISSQGGLIGGGKILMLTGAGKFDYADYTGPTTAKSGIFISGATNVRVQARIEMQTNAAIRTCNAIWVTGSTNVELEVDIFGFKEAQFGLIEWDSNVGGYVKAYVHDCGTAITTGLPSIQITGLSVDNNRAASVNSRRLRFDVHARNLTMAPATIAAGYGYQTDAVNLQGETGAGGSWSGHIGTVVAENVHEPIDIFCDHNVVDVTARDCLYGVKLIHGASHNVVRAAVHNYMKAAVVIAGSSFAQGTNNNRVYATATGGGEYNPGAFSDVTAALIDGGVTTHGANRNLIEITAIGDGINFDYGAAIGGGNDNTIVFEASGWLQQAARLYSGTNNRMKRLRPARVRAYLSANASYANDTTVVFNTEDEDTYGEFDAATGIYTAKSTCTLRVKYKANGQSVAAGGNFGSYIRRGGTTVSRKTDKNYGAAGSDVAHEHSALVSVVPGDTVFIRTDTSASVTHYGVSTLIEIEEVG